MPNVQANGINIYYELMGRGDPLALIGGSLFGRQNFAMVWEGLAKHFQLISYDQRGYGLTDRPLQPYSLDLWADDLAALLDALNIKRAHVMGTSAGGMIALKFAAKYPEKCIGVVSDCAFAKCDLMRRIMFRTWRHMAQSWGCSPQFADHVLTQAVGADFLEGPQGEAVIEMVREIVAMNSVETVVQGLPGHGEDGPARGLPEDHQPDASDHGAQGSTDAHGDRPLGRGRALGDGAHQELRDEGLRRHRPRRYGGGPGRDHPARDRLLGNGHRRRSGPNRRAAYFAAPRSGGAGATAINPSSS